MQQYVVETRMRSGSAMPFRTNGFTTMNAMDIDHLRARIRRQIESDIGIDSITVYTTGNSEIGQMFRNAMGDIKWRSYRTHSYQRVTACGKIRKD